MSEEEKKVEAAPAEAEANVRQTIEHKPEGPVVSPKALLAAGCHFGHRVSRWNPKRSKYIYGKRNNLHLIDLNKSAAQMQVAYLALKDIVSKGGKVLFVGTKAYAQKAVTEEAVRSGSFYVAKRWLGGTLTNFHTILKRIGLLRTIEQEELSGELEKLPKKEAAERLKLKAKLSANLEGIKEIRRLPQAIVVVDPKTEHNAIAEARLLHIPVFALGDTNTDPDLIDYLVPANDDGEASIRLIVGLFADAVVEGKGGEPVYAYKDADAAAQTRADRLKGVDQTEQIKSIRAKLRDDAIARRKNGKRVARKRFIKKNFHRFNDGNKPEGENKAAEAAKPAEAVEAPAASAEVKGEAK